MDATSPPKRVTRARAAAKTSESTTKPARVVTTAAKAKTAPRSAIKRKSPSDEDEDDHDHELAPAKKMQTVGDKPTRGRGRPKKAAVENAAPEPAAEPVPAPTVRARGRPKKIVEPVADEPAKTTRTARTKKSSTEEAEPAPEPVKKTTRGRPAISTKTTTTSTKSLAKPAVKKTVTFEEPEKENIVPVKKTAAPAATTGLRGKPVRKAASATTGRTARGTRAATTTTEASNKEEKPMPLSPKKINQLAINVRVESDDELGMEDKAPVRRFKKLPIKPAASAKKTSSLAKAVAPGPENDENAVSLARSEIEVNVMLATPAKRLPPSPWKGSIASPAKRVEGLLLTTSVAQTDEQTSLAASKMKLLQSPAKRQPLNLNLSGTDIINGTGTSSVKLSLLASPAKRPVSPVKFSARAVEVAELSVVRSPAPKPTLLASPFPPKKLGNPGKTDDSSIEEGGNENGAEDNIPESPTRPSFSGRLSAVLPRHADPALTPPMLALSEETLQNEGDEGLAEEAVEQDDAECLGEPMVVDHATIEVPPAASASTTPPAFPPAAVNPMFELREQELQPRGYGADSESEHDSPVKRHRFTSAFSTLPATPGTTSARTRQGLRSASRRASTMAQSDDKFGFTPLAQQLNGWTAGASPIQVTTNAASPTVFSGRQSASTPTEPAQNIFFENEMHVRPDAMDVEEEATTDVEDNDEPVLEDLSFTEEDMELAAEANEMSLVEKEPADDGDQANDDTISEASQEYGDENAIPIPVDPTLVAGTVSHAPVTLPVTPQRIVHREFHTVAKVPLKPADESTPRPKLEQRSYSASRLPPKRPTERLTRNATVISYSPTKGGDVDSFEEQAEDATEPAPPVTPQKADIWSTMGTPARTPRRDLNPALLRGAVVFVDVHTSEGADASGIFVELLTQMGARCVKTWAWNPGNSAEQGGDPRVGITHVVYKDGGKRTLEKVRESGGVVQCVGVSWVLDCERENQWLDEASYYIDTAVVPRGGARRRKSMEPRAIANLNGMLVPSPVRNNTRGSHTAPSTPAANNRRDSGLWIRSPDKSLDEDADHDASDHSDDDDANADGEWTAPLTPVPKTPAPEAIARYVANLSPGSTTSPSSVCSVESEDPLSMEDEESARREMLMRTCPQPKRTAFVELGEGILSKEKDERVLMRLMAARRKSLQFAPKVGSPLAKAWKAVN